MLGEVYKLKHGCYIMRGRSEIVLQYCNINIVDVISKLSNVTRERVWIGLMFYYLVVVLIKKMWMFNAHNIHTI